MNRREALTALTGLAAGVVGSSVMADECKAVKAEVHDSLSSSLFVLTLGEEFDADEPALARFKAKWDALFTDCTPPKLVILPTGCKLEQPSPYKFREAIGDYEYEVSFKTLDELNEFLRTNFAGYAKREALRQGAV